MAGLSDYAENKTLDHVYGNTPWSIPGTLYAALFTAAPTDAGGGTEPSVGSYARVAVTNNAANFPAASARAKSNANAITFPVATADWGTVVAFGFFDASTGGNLIAWQNLVTPRAILNGNTFSMAASQVSITWPTTDTTLGGATTYLVHKILDLIFSGTTWAIPASFFTVLFRADPTDAGMFTNEETGAGYSRVGVTNNTTNFPNAAGGQKSNGTVVNLPAPTGAWGAVTHGGLADANTAGNLYHYGPVPSTPSFNTGDTASISAGGLLIKQD